MWIEELFLQNFRNYSRVEVSFHRQLNILTGENAQGKTNLLEAIAFLAAGRSYRTRNESEITTWGEDGFIAAGRIASSRGLCRLKVGHDGKTKKKTFSINGVVLPRQQYLGRLITVLFTPDDLQLVKGGPQHRRKFIDEEIIKTSTIYESELIRYQQILRQRNRLLKTHGRKVLGSNELASWNEQLATSAARILRKRLEAVHRLGLLARLLHRRLTGRKENLEISYLTTLLYSARPEEGMLYDAVLAGLAEKKELEVRFGLTLTGPHRDDLRILIDGRDARLFASQGQQRTMVLSLKLAEVEYIKGETGELPVLLFDDVFSELDEARRTLLLETVDGGVQTFITGTEWSKQEARKRAFSQFQILNGEVHKIESCFGNT